MNEMQVKGIARGRWRETKLQENARTKKERNANEGVFKEMKGAEAAVKWKEVKGHERKLRGKGDERTGRGARWPAVSRQRLPL